MFKLGTSSDILNHLPSLYLKCHYISRALIKVVFTEQPAYDLFIVAVDCEAQCMLSPSKQHNLYWYNVCHLSGAEVIADFTSQFSFRSQGFNRSPGHQPRYFYVTTTHIFCTGCGGKHFVVKLDLNPAGERILFNK